MKKKINLFLIYLIIALCMVVLAGCSGQTVASTPTTQVPDVTQVPTLPELPTPTPTEDIASASVPPQLNEVASPKLDDFHMVDSLNGWGTTDNLLLVTYDGGATWFDITPPGVTRLGYLPSVLFIDPLDGWVVIPADNFVDGTLAITKDGGQNWELIPVPFSGGDIEFLDLNNGFIMVGRGAAAGSSAVDIYSTSDGGHNWTAAYQMQPGMGNDVNSLPFSGQKSGIGVLDTSNLWVGGSIPMDGNVYLYASHDGGISWAKQDITLPDGYTTTMTETQPPYFFNNLEGILPLRSYGTNTVYILYQTVDGGQNWSALEPVNSTGRICLISPSDFVIWDGGPSLLTSHDGGQSWSEIATNVNVADYLSKVEYTDINNGWMLTIDASDNHVLYTTQDGGATWIPLIP